MILENQITNYLLTVASYRTLALCTVLLLVCSSGCASSGTLQPHQAFRQATTPYQGYYQGAQSAYGRQGNFNLGAAGNYSGYSGYNNSPPSYGGPSTSTGAYQAYGNPFANPYENLPAGQPTIQGGYGQYSYPPNAGYNYQPAYSGGFTSGSC